MRLLSTTAVSALATALLGAAGAQADPCKQIDTTIVTTFSSEGCASPVGLCTDGTVASGRLAGTTHFTALSVTQGPIEDSVAYTGELVITAKNGTVTLRDAGLVLGATGQYYEVQQVVAGTGPYRHAVGVLTSAGAATGTGFEGSLEGAVCSGGSHGEVSGYAGVAGSEDAPPDDFDAADEAFWAEDW